MKMKLLSLRVILGITIIGLWGLCPHAAGWAHSSSSESLQATASPPAAGKAAAEVALPGPLRPFLRMAAISQGASPEEVLPLLARNVAVMGYMFVKEGDYKPKEYLLLLKSYVQQARELQPLAGPDGEIWVTTCSDAAPLLKLLGYSVSPPCGTSTTLDVADPKRAFLTLDSGFPLTRLEQALQRGKPFSYAFASAHVPVLFDPRDWSTGERDVIASLLDDPLLAKLYWSLSRVDESTRATLWQSSGLRKLLPLAPALDYYGSQITISSGRVLVPGGEAAEATWRKLAGAGPESPVEFVARLLEKDRGWLAAYFDALARSPRPLQAYFTEPRRLTRFYQALRGRDLTPSPARGFYRAAPGLLLLATRLQLDPDGQPQIPGGLEIWKKILREKNDDWRVRDWARRSRNWNQPEQLIEAMFSLSRMPQKDGPFYLYWSLSEMNRRRSPQRRLSPQVVHLLAENFTRYRSQYSLFAEFGDLDEDSITQFITAARSLDAIGDGALRADAIGTLQASVGLWQILARQDEIRAQSLNESWQQTIRPFVGIKSSEQLFDAGRTSLAALCRAASGRSWFSQEELLALLAGPDQTGKAGQRMRQSLADRMRAVLDAQQLVSLSTLFELADGMNDLAQRKPVSTESLTKRASEIRQFEMPKPIFTDKERTELYLAPGQNPHAALQTRVNLVKLITQSAGSPRQLAKARGLLTPFLRDTLVGLNYAYYEPPGAQMLHTNPLFVRLHDFSLQLLSNGRTAWEESHLVNRGWNASGGAHLEGSLADLPHVLASAEEGFIVPDNIQALIWEDLVPELLAGAVLPRWWRVTRKELHAVTLYQRSGEELLAAAAQNPALRQKLLDILAERVHPNLLNKIAEALDAGQQPDTWSHLVPADTFYLAAEFRRQYPAEAGSWGSAGAELELLAHQVPEEVSRERISRDFGIPHPALANSRACELLALKPLPSLLGFSTRLLAESWESNNLYWGRLADEKDLDPVLLHDLVPALTRRMVERIFGTYFEDWPALLRALRETGEDFRSGKIGLLPRVADGAGAQVSHPDR
jgi:hypothetical protein